MHSLTYKANKDAVSWKGIQFIDNAKFDSFMGNEVGSRLYDEDGKTDFTAHLSSLASTGFAQQNLQAILAAEQPEERDWAVGEALAEAWLSHKYGVVWPWNTERDKRTPKASLPGADLIGFMPSGQRTYLVLGEVKSSSEAKNPPNVMTGRSGMVYQLESLITDTGIMFSLIRWLQPRCRRNNFELLFNEAVITLLSSSNKTMALFGVLVRDTAPNEKDLKNRAISLAKIVKAPTSCNLLGLYLPCSISNLPSRVQP